MPYATAYCNEAVVGLQKTHADIVYAWVFVNWRALTVPSCVYWLVPLNLMLPPFAEL